MKTKQQQNKEYYEKHKSEILAKRKAHRAVHGQKQYPKSKEWRRAYWKQWYAKNAPEYLAKKRAYALTPAGKQNQLERTYRFMERHPFYDLEFLERMIQLTERNVNIEYIL